MSAFSKLIAAVSIAFLGGCASHPWYDVEYPPSAPPGGVNVTFLGVSTVVFEFGGRAIATDGFFSRPDVRKLLKVKPNEAEINRIWDATNIGQLDAVITVHSHYDHAMDAPDLAEKTGAVLIGSQSTKFVAEGVGYGGTVYVVDPVKPTSFLIPERAPVFKVTTVRSKHGPTPFSDEEEITEPLVPPVPFTEYKEGGCFSVLIEFLPTGKTVLVHSSAGYLPGALSGHKADVVYLGIVPLGSMSDADREAYWREVVEAVGARRVFPIHWDDMFDRLRIGEEELEPLPRLAHNFDAAMRFLKKKSDETGVEVILPRAWRKTDPFSGPPAPTPRPAD